MCMLVAILCYKEIPNLREMSGHVMSRFAVMYTENMSDRIPPIVEAARIDVNRYSIKHVDRSLSYCR